MTLFAEFRRRNVFKVGAAYLAVAWLLYQLGVNLEGTLNLPAWFDTTILILLAIGFPVALFLAWAYELTPDGIRPSRAEDPVTSAPRPTGQRLNRVIIVALSLAVVFLIVDNYVLDATDQADAMPSPSGERAAVTPPRVAILPFENLSDDEGSTGLARGVYHDIFNELDRLGRLTVVNRQAMKRYEGTLLTFAQIAEETNVQFVMSLVVRSAADQAVRIDAALWSVNGPDEERVWGEVYDEAYTPEKLVEIQTSIARNISEQLVGELSPADEARLAEVLTDNPNALNFYHRALPYTDDATQENADNCLAVISEAVALDSQFKQAWYRKAVCHQIRASFDSSIAQEEQQFSIEAIERALAIDDEYAEAQAFKSPLLAAGGNWRAAAVAHRRAGAAGVRLLEANSTGFLFPIGRLQDALEVSEQEFNRDREGSAEIQTMARMSIYEAVKDEGSADETYRLGRQLFQSWPAGVFARHVALMGRARQGEVEHAEVVRYFREDRMPLLPDRLYANAVSENFDDLEALIAYLRDRMRMPEALENGFNQLDIAALAAYAGAPELSLEALRNSLSLYPINVSNVWLPLFRDVRQLEEFRDYMREIDMVDVWREVGWPDLCRPLAGGDDFQCD